MSSTLIDVWKFFSPFLGQYKIKLATLLMLPMIWCLVETIAPYLIKIMIDDLAVTHFGEINHLIAAYIALILVLELSTRSCNYVWIKTLPYIKADMQKKILACIEVQPFDVIYNQLAGDLINKYRNLSESFEKIFKAFLYGFYPTVLSFFFSIIFIAFISKFFAMVFLFWFLVMNLVTVLFFNKNIIVSEEQSKKQDQLLGYVGNFICNAITMLAFSREMSKEHEFETLVVQNIHAAEEVELVTFKADIWRSVASWVLLSGMIVFLGFGWQKSWITLGDFAFIGGICFYVRRTIWMTSFQLAEFFKDLGIMQNTLPLVLNSQKGEKEFLPEIEIDSATPFKADLVMHNVSFGYANDKMLFKNLNLHIRAGQKIGILGNSGVGKTSLIQLFLRFYDPSQGVITIDGYDCRQLTVKRLRDFFSYVPQNISLLHRSIFENIAFGKVGASKEEVYEASRVCLCEEFILCLENGYDTVVGEGGYKLSGGQRQRIALARAYLKKAPIFILDEALSGLEVDLEERLLESLCQNLKTHTIILISHRDSALRKMERVLKLAQGSIIELETEDAYFGADSIFIHDKGEKCMT